MPASPVLFVTRKFPPIVGGMETLSESVWRCLSTQASGSRLVANRRGNRWLPIFLPVAVARVLAATVRGSRPIVLCGDALMYAVLAPMLRLLRLRHATMVMGLDITFDNRIYRALVHPWLRRAERVLAISRATAEVAISAGVPRERVSVVRLGVRAPGSTVAQRMQARDELFRWLELADGDVVLLTLGRAVRRKGSRWFIEEVVPHLPASTHYVVAGSGAEVSELERAVAAGALGGRVHLLGTVGETEREILMAGCHAFIQPNIKVVGDMEGFGLVAVEAAMRGPLVVAADLEGLADAVIDGETGILLPSGEPGAWITRLTELCTDPVEIDALGARYATRARSIYSEAAMGRRLLEELERLGR